MLAKPLTSLKILEAIHINSILSFAITYSFIKTYLAYVRILLPSYMYHFSSVFFLLFIHLLLQEYFSFFAAFSLIFAKKNDTFYLTEQRCLFTTIFTSLTLTLCQRKKGVQNYGYETKLFFKTIPRNCSIW